MTDCHFEGYCDRQNMVNSKVCLAKEGECLWQKNQDKGTPLEIEMALSGDAIAINWCEDIRRKYEK